MGAALTLKGERDGYAVVKQVHGYGRRSMQQEMQVVRTYLTAQHLLRSPHCQSTFIAEVEIRYVHHPCRALLSLVLGCPQGPVWNLIFRRACRGRPER